MIVRVMMVIHAPKTYVGRSANIILVTVRPVRGKASTGMVYALKIAAKSVEAPESCAVRMKNVLGRPFVKMVCVWIRTAERKASGVVIFRILKMPVRTDSDAFKGNVPLVVPSANIVVCLRTGALMGISAIIKSEKTTISVCWTHRKDVNFALDSMKSV